MTRARATFRSLHIRNYRLFFGGQLVSLIGTWMQTVALAWVVYQITNSPTQIGVITAVQFVPTLVASMHVGVFVDRFDKRKILIATQSAFVVQASVLAGFALSGNATLPVLYTLAIIQGCITTIDNPTRQAFVSELVGPDELTNAIGLNSAMFNMARVLGPSIGGVLIETVGAGTCFALNAVSFVAVIGGLVAMRVGELHPATRVQRAKGQLREGLVYAWRDPTLRMVLLMIAVIGTLAMNFLVVLPVVARQVFHGNSETYGFFSGVMGGGSLVGSLFAASRAKPTVRLLAAAAVGFGAAMICDAIAPSIGLEVVALALTGAASITLMATANATLQLTSRPEMRGRVMSLYMLLFLGSTPIGGPVMGWISQTWGARWSLAVGGVACLAATGFAVPALRQLRGPRGAPARQAEPATA